MAVAVKGTATSSATTSVTIPTHAVGDLILLVAYNKSAATVPTKPAASGTVPAWVTIDTGSGSTNANISAYFVATASNHTSGTWTSATGMVAIVLTGQSPAVVGGHARGNNASSLTVTGHAITLTNADGSSQVLAFWGKNNAITSWGTVAGYTDQVTDTTGNVALATENTPTSGAAAGRTTTGTAGVGDNDQIEIVSGPHPSDATVTAESFGLAGPILYEPINTADTVTVQIAGGPADDNVNVSDSTTTGESVTANLLSFVSVTDSTTTAENVPTPDIPGFAYSVNVSDSTTTGNTPTVAPPSQNPVINVSDSTTTAESVTVAPLVLPGISVTDSTTTANTPTVSFPVATDTVSVSDSTTTAESFGLAGPILYEPINTADSVTVQITGGVPFSPNVSDSTATSESVSVQVNSVPPQTISVSDSTSTSEWIVIAFDPPIIFTLEVDVADSTTTGNTPTVTPLVIPGVSVGDSTTTGESVNVNLPVGGTLTISVSDSTATGESVTIAPLLLPGISATDSTTTGNTPTVAPLVLDGASVTDSTTTGESVTVGPLVLPGIAVSDSTTTASTAVTVQLVAAGTLSINVASTVTTTNTPTVTPLLLAGVHTTDSVTTANTPTVFFQSGAPPIICYPTSATFASNTTSALFASNTTTVAIPGYTSDAVLGDNTTNVAMSNSPSTAAIVTHTASVDLENYISATTVGTCPPGHEDMAIRRAKRRRMRLNG